MKKGFTLIELVVAIAVLGVVMIIAIPSVRYIQSSNKDTKYRVYGKAINAAGKLYTDSFSEDLFGISNHGCAVIKYQNLKDKKLIEDIQVKNANCATSNTCVVVRKSKNGNYHYETNIVCNLNGEEVFREQPSSCSDTTCKLEDSSGPNYVINVDPQQPKYYLGDHPKINVEISDVGVGLKENQALFYQWYKGTNTEGAQKKLAFKNENFASKAKKDIEMLSTLENIDEPTKYTVKIMGSLYDLDNNRTNVSENVVIDYFVGALHIQMHANGGYLKNPHNSAYSIDSGGYIVHKNTGRIISTIKYNGTLGSTGLLNYDNPSYVNLARTHYHIDSGKEWNRKADGTGKNYDQDKVYGLGDFGYRNSDLIRDNKTVDLYANWIVNKYTLTYDNNGGRGCNSKTVAYGNNWGPLCTPTRTGYNFTGWKNGTTTITENSPVQGDITVKAQWSPKTYKLTYDNNGGTGCTYKTGLYDSTWGPLCTPKKTGYTFTGWKNGSNDVTSSTKVTGDLTVQAQWRSPQVQIRFHVNGGTMASAHGVAYSISSGYVKKNNDVIIHRIKYGGSLSSDGLINYNNKDALNIVKTGYHIDASSAWKNEKGETFNQTTAYAGSRFCDASKGDCIADLYANWKINVCSITYSPNGGKFTKNSSDTKQTLNYGQSISDMRNAAGGYYTATNSYFYPKSKAEWKIGSKTFNQDNGYAATTICSDLATKSQSVTFNVNWYYDDCKSGNIINNQNITYSDIEKGKVSSSDVIVRTFHWNYEKNKCNSEKRYRKYKFIEISCICKIDKNSKKFCNDVNTMDVTSITHPNHATFVRYYNTTNGLKACKGEIAVNSYVTKICTEDMGSRSSMFYHGYYFYKGAVGDYNSFSSSYWTHNISNFNDRVSASSSAATACKKVCGLKYK